MPHGRAQLRVLAGQQGFLLTQRRSGLQVGRQLVDESPFRAYALEHTAREGDLVGPSELLPQLIGVGAGQVLASEECSRAISEHRHSSLPLLRIAVLTTGRRSTANSRPRPQRASLAADLFGVGQTGRTRGAKYATTRAFQGSADRWIAAREPKVQACHSASDLAYNPQEVQWMGPGWPPRLRGSS